MVSRLPRVVLCSLDPEDQWPPDWRPFNYSARTLLAAIASDPKLDLERATILDFYNRDVDSMLERVLACKPDVLGLSAYVWSFPIFLNLARQVRAARPECAIIMGGPSARPAMFNLPRWHEGMRWVDALAIGESEATICEIAALEAPCRPKLAGVRGLMLPNGGLGWRSTGERPLPDPLDDLASPFQLGLVTEAVTAHLETFRGCPMSCSFCQWGELGAKGSRVFSKEYLVRELEAYKRAGVVSVFNIDPALNLNAKAFRNLVEAEREVGFFKEKAVTVELYPSLVTDEHLDFLSQVNVMHIGIGIDSFDNSVLEGLNRKFSEKRLRNVLKRLEGHGTVLGHLIMGLPGDTPQGFRDNIKRMEDLGVGATILHCLVLPDALMSRVGKTEDDLHFDPVTLKLESCNTWSEKDVIETVEYLDELSMIRANGMRNMWMWQWNPGEAAEVEPPSLRAQDPIAR
jgi:radical SAM superfamily enzyme YgiQ (UPF0313 family)